MASPSEDLLKKMAGDAAGPKAEVEVEIEVSSDYTAIGADMLRAISANDARGVGQAMKACCMACMSDENADGDETDD